MKESIKFVTFLPILAFIVCAIMHLIHVLGFMPHQNIDYATAYWAIPLIAFGAGVFVIFISPLIEWWLE